LGLLVPFLEELSPFCKYAFFRSNYIYTGTEIRAYFFSSMSHHWDQDIIRHITNFKYQLPK
jgi:hypothetical protein